jgi:hypothetical protein
MRQSDHSWRAFRQFHYTPYAKEVFKKVGEFPQDQWDSINVEKTTLYQKIFTVSTDFIEATDNINLNLAQPVGNMWMWVCGIPPMLKGIVNALCYLPCWIEFAASGFLETIGEPCPGRPGYRRIRMTRGLRMGDPLTKPVLHLFNIGIRDMANNALVDSWLAEGFKNPAVVKLTLLGCKKRIL